MHMYAAMLASPFKGLDVRPYLDDDDCAFQQKMDGDRLLGIWRPQAPVQFVSRSGSPYTKKIPKTLLDLRRPQWNDVSTLIFDGELVGDTWHIFDFLVVLFGEKVDRRPYDARRGSLVSLFGPYADHPNMRLLPEALDPEDKALFLEQAIQRNAEGVIVKRRRSAYRFGKRSPEWLKIKFERTADVIILATGNDGKESAQMVVRDGDRILHVGDVSTLGKGDIQPGMVVEVKYLYATDNHRLYQPRILRVRDDKSPVECTVDQLHYTDKGALVR